MNNIILIRNAKSYDFGGGERFPIFISDSLKKLGYNPIILSRHNKVLQLAKSHNIATIKGWWWSKQNWSGAHTLLIPLYFLWQIILMFYYIAIFLRLHPTAVHIQSKDDFIAATYAAQLVGARAIWTDHADLKHIWKNITVWYKNPVGKLVYIAAHFANTITLVSKSEKSEVKANLPKNTAIAKKLTVIYNGVTDQKANYPNKKQLKFTYGVVGRLVVDKGINEAIQAFKIINKKHPNTQLLLIGTGPDEQLFKDKCSNINNIIFTGHQTNPLAYMAKLDVFMQPTYHEGFSVSLVEACMMQRPIIATNVGGNVEIIKHNHTGLLIKPKDINQLCGAMDELYSNHKLAKKLATAARQQYLDKFIFDTIVKERFVPLYEKSAN